MQKRALKRLENPSANEELRLAALQKVAILDTPPEESYDRIARTACVVAQAPIALVSFTDADRQWFKSAVGLQIYEADRSLAICAHAIQHDFPIVVPDTQADARFASLPCVAGAPNIRFYAGFPLILSTGEALGTLCVLDFVPRALTPDQISALSDLAAVVTEQLELRQSVGDTQGNFEKIKRNAQALKKTRDFFRSIVDACTDAIAVYHPERAPDGTITDFVLTDCNLAAEKARGLDKRKMLGKSLRVLVPNLTEETIAQYVHVIETGEPYHFTTHYADQAYDDWFNVSATRHSNGGLVIVTTTVTEEKHAELKLRRSRDALASFTAAVSHDLRTPLGHISGFIELIADDLGERLDPQNKEFMRYVTDGAEQMRRLIDAMQKHARLGQITIDRKTFSLEKLLRDITHRFEGGLEDINGTVKLHDLPEISADPVLLDQLFSNLMSNAIRYRSHERPLEIEVRAKITDRTIAISFTDNGIGVAPEHGDRIFNLFERGPAPDKDDPGIGLGLATCRSIAKAHSGAIDVDPHVTEGTSFILEIPTGKGLVERSVA